MTDIDPKCEDVWGAGNVLRVDSSEEFGDWLTPQIREDLSTTCLPKSLPPLFAEAKLERLEAQPKEFAVKFGLGWHDECAICVEESSGQVVSVHTVTKELTFVNSGLSEFSRFLVSTGRISKAYDEAEEGRISRDDYLRKVERARTELRATDPPALVDGGWWAGIVEEFSMI